jgi:hypothetical protein
MRSSDCGARGRGTTVIAGGDLRVAVTGPIGERLGGEFHDVVVLAVADRDQRRHRRPNRPRVKHTDIVGGHRRERGLAANRRVAVGMLPVEQLQERAIGERAGHVAQLREAVQPQLADPREIVVAQRRPRDDVREQRQHRLREAAEHGDAHHGRVGADVGVELRAEPRQRFVDLNRRPIAAALVEHVGRHGRQSVLTGGIRGRAATNQQREGDERHLCMPDGPDVHAARQHRLADRRERQRRRRQRNRQARPIDLDGARRSRRAHETAAMVESGAASAVRP